MKENHSKQALKNRAVAFLWVWKKIKDTGSGQQDLGWKPLQAKKEEAKYQESVDAWNNEFHDDVGYFPDDDYSPTLDEIKEHKQQIIENNKQYGSLNSTKEESQNRMIDPEDYQYLLTHCENIEGKGWGLYRVDIAMNDDDKCTPNHYQDALEEIIERIKKHDKASAQYVTIVIDVKTPIKIDIGMIKMVGNIEGHAQYQSNFLLKRMCEVSSQDEKQRDNEHSDTLCKLALSDSGLLQLSVPSSLREIDKKEKIDDMADEYADMLLRIIKADSVEVSARRLEHIRHSIDRHLPLIERLQAMQRRLEHDCHALKRWWFQLRGKVGELSHVVVDSTYDLALELEQNNRRINKSIDYMLRHNIQPFLQWGEPFQGDEGKESVVDYMAAGGKYRKAIQEHTQVINAQLENDRSVLEKVSSLVDSSDQRATNRALNRMQTWGALLASVAIFTGMMGNFSLDGVNYLTDVILKSTPFAWLGTASFVGLLFYGLRLLWRKGHEERIESLVLNIIVPAILISPILWLYLQDFFVSMNAWLETNSMYEGVPLIYGITYFFVVFSVLLLLRQKDLQSWLMLRRNLSGDAEVSKEQRSILRVEGEILDAYEKFFQKKGCVGNEADQAAIKQLKDNWQYLAEAMDDIDAEKHKEEHAKGSFKEQVSSIRDEVLLARAISQCILRLPEYIQGLKNEELAEHVMLRANIDFDPMPNAQKIRKVHQGSLLPAYLPPYNLDDYCSQYLLSEDKEDRYWEYEDIYHYSEDHLAYLEHRLNGDVVNALGEKIYATILESICLYLDIETLKLIEKVFDSKKYTILSRIHVINQAESSLEQVDEGVQITLKDKKELNLRLQRHLSRQFVDLFLFFLDVTPFETLPKDVSPEKIEQWLQKGKQHAMLELPKKKVDLAIRDIKRFVIDRDEKIVSLFELKMHWGINEYHDLNKNLRQFIKNGLLDVNYAYEKVQEMHRQLIQVAELEGIKKILSEIKQWDSDGVGVAQIANDLLLCAQELAKQEQIESARLMYNAFWTVVDTNELEGDLLHEYTYEYAEVLTKLKEYKEANNFFNRSIDSAEGTKGINEVKFKIAKNLNALGSFSDAEVKLREILNVGFNNQSWELDNVLSELALSLGKQNVTVDSLLDLYKQDDLTRDKLVQHSLSGGVPSEYAKEVLENVVSLCAMCEYEKAKQKLELMCDEMAIPWKKAVNIKDYINKRIVSKVGGM